MALCAWVGILGRAAASLAATVSQAAIGSCDTAKKAVLWGGRALRRGLEGTMGEVYSLTCALLWAFGVVLLRRGGETVGPLPLNVFKNTFATLLMIVTMPLVGAAFWPAQVETEHVVILLVSGALGLGIADTMFLAALNRLGAGRTAVVECAYGPSVLLCAALHPQLQEPVGVGAIGAVVLIAAGISVAAREGGDRPDEAPARRAVREGVALGLGAIVLMAIGFVMAKPVLEQHGVWWVTLVRFGGGFLVLIPMSLRPTARGSVAAILRPGPDWKVVAPAAFVGTYLAMLFWIAGLKHSSAGTAALLSQTSTFFVVLLAVPMLGERLSARRLFAVLLGFCGALLVAMPAYSGA
jgi:drug/metabolite transporter (DMT)-like permease